MTANYGLGMARVLLGRAGGGFAAVTTYSTGTGSNPFGVALGDVNGDGRLDIVTGNNGTGTAGVLLNTGTFTPLATARSVAADVSLYPNPAHDGFTIRVPAAFGPAPVRAELLHALGQVMRRLAATGPRFPVGTSGLAASVYTLHLHTGSAAVTKRVVME